MSVKFWVEKDGTQLEAVKINLRDLYANFTILIEGMEVKASVTTVSLNDIDVTFLTFGHVDLKKVA
jgi:hypothetical protein